MLQKRWDLNSVFACFWLKNYEMRVNKKFKPKLVFVEILAKHLQLSGIICLWQ